MLNRPLALITWTCLVAFSFAAPAAAHISLERGGTHLSRYGDGELKSLPCGRAGGTRGTHIYTYEPGQTITVSLVETISHPSYFRIAFEMAGDSEFKEPASILPIDPNRQCPDGPGDHCGASDFYNTPNVLPGLDNLNPHLASFATPTYTWSVTLPNVECDTCTLQIIQVMEDDAAHGPYDPTPGVGVEDIYHQCIDLVLKRGAASGDGGQVVDAGATQDGASGAVDGGMQGTAPDLAVGGVGGMGGGGLPAPASSGGCAVTGHAASAAAAATTASAILLALGFLSWRRRRARRE